MNCTEISTFSLASFYKIMLDMDKYFFLTICLFFYAYNFLHLNTPALPELSLREKSILRMKPKKKGRKVIKY